MKKLFIFLGIVGLFFVMSCQQRSDGSCGEEICTTDFVKVNIWLKDSVGNIFMPDSVATYTTNGILLHKDSLPVVANSGYYTLVDDGNFSTLPHFFFTSVLFNIYKNDSLLKSEPYIVSANCCHVFKQAGADTIMVK